MVTQELISRKEKLFVSCSHTSFTQSKMVPRWARKTSAPRTVQRYIWLCLDIPLGSSALQLACEGTVIQGCKSHTYSHTHIHTQKHNPPAIIAAISGSRTKLPFNNKITHFLSSSSRDKKSVRQYIGNEKWYWRWAGVKPTRFFQTFDIFKKKVFLYLGIQDFWIWRPISGTRRATGDPMVANLPDFWELFKY